MWGGWEGEGWEETQRLRKAHRGPSTGRERKTQGEK